MTKRQIVRMYNELAKSLGNIKSDLVKYIEQNTGAEWVDHGTDDSDLICFKWRDMVLGVYPDRWFVDHKQVSFFEFLATITQE